MVNLTKILQRSIWLFILLLLFIPARPTEARGDYIMVVEMDGAIVPAMESYLERVLNKAAEENAELVIIQLDTPGGSVEIMENIVSLIRESEVPVVIYVSPRGAKAGSAGVFITLSGHRSAMAPNTVIGAASVVSGDGSDVNETMERKITNSVLALLRTLTEDRPEEAQQLAEEMVTEATAVTASEALEIGLIDYVASDVDELIELLDGETIQLRDETITLDLAGLETQQIEMSLIEQILLALTNPFLVYLFLSTGGLLLVIEFRTPGGFIAGTLGAILLLLAIYGLGILPINLFGIAVMALAFIFFAFEIIVPETQGALSIVGGVLLAIGGLVMFGNDAIVEFGGISTFAIIGQSLLIGLMSAALLYVALRHLGKGDTVGSSALIGMIGESRSPLTPQGKVFVNGEWWNAESASGANIPSREPVRVVNVGEHMLLEVETVPIDDMHGTDEKPKR